MGNAIDPNVIKAVTMVAHAWLHNCVFAEMDIAAQIVELRSVPLNASEANVLVRINAAVMTDTRDVPASRLYAEKAVSTVIARFRSVATAT